MGPLAEEEALIKAERDLEYARFHESPAKDGPPDRRGEAKLNLPGARESGRNDPMRGSKSGLPIDRRKLPLKNMVKFMVNVLTGTSAGGVSKADKMSMTTAIYWMAKVFAFIFGRPGNALQKSEKLLDPLLKCKETVRCRD